MPNSGPHNQKRNYKPIDDTRVVRPALTVAHINALDNLLAYEFIGHNENNELARDLLRIQREAVEDLSIPQEELDAARDKALKELVTQFMHDNRGTTLENKVLNYLIAAFNAGVKFQ